MLTFENSQPPVKLEDIIEFEKEIGYSLPNDYKEKG